MGAPATRRVHRLLVSARAEQPQHPSLVAVDVQRGGISTTQISSTETVQAVATVTGIGGSPVEGVVVTFSQTTAALLMFDPLAGTALTDVNGKAKLDLGAISATGTGEITIQAVAQIGSSSATATRSIQIAAAAPVPAGVSTTPSSINFIGAVPKGTAIVIKGAGGNGRSESALLTFRVVNASNAAINGAIVDFKINENNGGAIITPSQFMTTNSDALVGVTVSSGTQPSSIVVVATARSTPSVSTPSDTVVVSNGIVVSGSFEIAADKYNLNGTLTSDSAVITAYIADKFGNPVADGLIVSFQTDFGAVTSSILGGCSTLNGTCAVTFRVQEPRGEDGIATVRTSVRVGAENTLSTELRINMSGRPAVSYMLNYPNGAIATTLSMSTCKETFDPKLSAANQHATAAGTTVTVSYQPNIAVTVKAGSPVPDQRIADFPPTAVALEVDLTGASLVPACKPSGIVSETRIYFTANMTPPGTTLPNLLNQRIFLAYPQ